MSEVAEVAEPDGDRNVVQLSGKVSVDPAVRTMPSGDQVVTWRLVVRRPAPSRRVAADAPKRPTFDTIDCVAWDAGVRRRVQKWRRGDSVECEGVLHRRFWRSGESSQSRCEVEVRRAHRVRLQRG